MNPVPIRRNRPARGVAGIGLVVCFALGSPVPSKAPVPTERLRQTHSILLLSFEANRGQADPATKFLTRGEHFTALLRPNQMELILPASRDAGLAIRTTLEGSTPTAALKGERRLTGVSNYFRGSDPSKWLTNISNFERVRCRGVYPGIDAVYYGTRRRLEYDFVIAPGADPGQIRMRIEGVESMWLDQGGDLVLVAAGREIRHHKPVIYQDVRGWRRRVEGGYLFREPNVIGFEVQSYDRTLPLVIDPLLTYSGFLGGRAGDEALGIAVDSAGNTYITGSTQSGNFPTTNPYQATNRGAPDAFVTKLNSTGGALIYSTYLGGNGADEGRAISVDRDGNAYVSGITNSTFAGGDFPVTPRAFRTRPASIFRDAFVAKLSSSGSLVYSTYLGGSGVDEARGIAIDSSGSVFVTGSTVSTDLPVSPNALQRSFSGGFPSGDAFVAKVNPTGSALAYATYLGGADDDAGTSITVDRNGSVYVTGITYSVDFPTQNPFQRVKGGGSDAFVAKVSPDGTSLGYATYLGGGNIDQGFGIVVDSQGSAYVTGETRSAEFPTINAMQQIFGGFSDAFVTKFNAAGSGLVFSTYLGGRFTDVGYGIAVDDRGNIYVTGSASSDDFPLANAIQASYGGGFADAFVARLNAAGTTLLYATYLGGSADEAGHGIALDSSGNAYITGETLSAGFVTTPGVVQPSYGGGTVFVGDAFVCKLTTDTVVTLSAASFSGRALAAESIATAFGEGLTPRTEAATATPLPTSLAGSQVRVTDANGVPRPAPLFFVSPGQINFLIPAGTAAGLATIEVAVEDRVVALGTARIEAVAPALFSANADGRGVAAAVAVRASPAGGQTVVPVFQCSGAPGGCRSVPITFGPENEQLVLLLFGTGIRGIRTLARTTVTIGGQSAQVLSAGPQGTFVGLDQVNVVVPRRLAGRGEVPVVLAVEGRTANTVTVNLGQIIRPPCTLPLTPGEPLPFRLPPAAASAFFSGDVCVAVPEGASRLQIRVVTATPDVDVDLFVRFGAPPTLGALGVVADYASTGPTGSETVTITRDSSPALRPGVYFLGLGLLPTPREVTGTIAAVVE